MKLIISNLSDETEPEDLKKMFQEYGKVEQVTFLYNVYTKKFRGMAYVEMTLKQDAQMAMEQLEGSIFKGNSISVGPVIPKKL